MHYKPRHKPIELMILESLHHRMNLTAEVKQHYFSLKRGYEGEVLFDHLTEKIQSECYVLNDLLFEVKNTTFQIDTLIIMQDKIYLYEIKNFEGDYYYETDKLYKKPNLEVMNPLHQLSRSESLFRHLLLQLGYKLPIHASIVFINPTFTLYQAPLDKPFIFPTQVHTHLRHINMKPSKLTDRHKRLAEQLLERHITNSPYKKIPSYDFASLRKGILCEKCFSYKGEIVNPKLICPSCKHEEPVADAVIRTTNEFQTLFPNEKITTSIIHQWCLVISCKKRIQRILSKHYTQCGDHRWTYYQ